MDAYYQNGSGTLFCGDCLTEVLPQLKEESVDLVITSPPYPGNNTMWGELFQHTNVKEAHQFLGQVWHECLRVLRPGCKLIINIANTKRRPYIPNTRFTYNAIGDEAEPLGEIIWDKGYGQVGTAWGSFCNPSDPSLADQHEYILVFRKWGERRKYPGYMLSARNFKSWRNSLWRIPPAKASQVGHVAPFPHQIPERLILLYSYEGEVILDPFFGSGTTGQAAQKHRRRWIGIEIAEENCVLAKKRIRVAEVRLSLFGDEEIERKGRRQDFFK